MGEYWDMRSRLLFLFAGVLLLCSACDQDAHSSEADVTVGAVFANPLTLPEVEELASKFGGEVTALWRHDDACVPVATFGSPQSAQSATSRFAYWHADEIVERQTRLGPPPTDGDWSNAVRQKFAYEWEQAKMPSVRFDGAVFAVQDSSDVRDPRVIKGTTVDSYKTDGASVLYLEGHEQALASLFPIESAPC